MYRLGFRVKKMAFTTVQRVKDLMRDQGASFHNAPVEAAITNAVAGANAYLEEIGVPASTTDAGLLIAADRLAMTFLMEGELVRQMLRGESQATGSFRITINEMRQLALNDALTYVPITVRSVQVRANRNFAQGRGGALYGGSEAGGYARRGSKR